MRKRITLGAVAVLAAVATAAPAAMAGSTAPRTSAASVGGVAIFTPSTSLHQSTASVRLRSPSPVATVTRFYLRALPRDGWTIKHQARTPASTNLIVRRTGKGATVQITKSGAATEISIVVYPS